MEPLPTSHIPKEADPCDPINKGTVWTINIPKNFKLYAVELPNSEQLDYKIIGVVGDQVMVEVRCDRNIGGQCVLYGWNE